MTDDPLDRIEENAGELRRNADRFAVDEPFLSVVLDDGERNLRALVEVARAARGVRRYARRVDLDFAASKGYDLDAALARLPKEQP